MPARPYHHGDLRTALLARAEQTVRDKGVDALSLRELARDIGVSHAAPSRHFKDKQTLLDALALAGFERLNDELERAYAKEGQTSDRMRAVAHAYADFAIKNAALLELMYTRKHEQGASPELVAAGQRLGESTGRLIVEAQQAGEMRSGDFESIALVVFAAIHGYAVLVASGMLPHGWKAPDGLDAIVEAVQRGLRP
jgi:AcrR family transcriptional regulator